MYKNNMWGLLGLYQCLKKSADPEVSLAFALFESEESKASSTSSIHGMFITLVLTPFHSTTLFCIDQL